VPSRSEVVLSTKVVFNDLTSVRPEKETQWITEAHALRCGLKVSRTILPDGDVDIPVRAMNTLSHPIKLQAGTIISDLEPVELCDSGGNDVRNVSTENDPVLVDIVNRADASVELEDRRRLMDLLTEFRGTFSRGENDLGRTDVVTHNIDTSEGRPVRQALRRHPPAHLDAI